MTEEVYLMLSNVQNNDIVQEVPRGPKENCHFFVDFGTTVEPGTENKGVMALTCS